jgi:hypothetical protein
MTLVRSIGQSIPVVVRTPQPTRPPTATPPRIGLVEISKIETAETPESILAKLLTVDGAGSGLDADLLDGQHGQYYVDLANATGDLPPSALVPSELLAAIKTVDGDGSGLDADLLDGQHGSYYATAARATAIETKNTEQDGRLGAVEGRATAVENKNGEQDTRLTTIDALNVVQSSRLTSIEGVNGTQDGRLDVIETKNTQQDAAINLRLTDAPSDGLTYGRKNAAWSTIVGGAVISDTVPPGPLQAGQLWWESDSGALFLWYADPNSQQWVQVNSTSPAPPLKAPTRSIHTSSVSNMPIPDGATHVAVAACGGGGSGGGVNGSGATGTSAGAAGGGGGGAFGRSGSFAFSLAGITSYSATIGAGGTGVAAGGASGGATTITFNGSGPTSASTFNLGGGTNGGTSPASSTVPYVGIQGGTGGQGGLGGQPVGGHSGQPGMCSLTGSIQAMSGAGGSTEWGTGGGPQRIGSASGNAGYNAAGWGAGGGGACSIGTTNNYAGGNGSGGRVELVWLYGMTD